jgi:hypothetical protein
VKLGKRKEHLKELIEKIQCFRFCTPSADPEELTAVTSGYYYLVTQLKSQASRILSEEGKRQLNAIEVEIDNIYSAYEAKANVDAILLDIEDALERSVEDDFTLKMENLPERGVSFSALDSKNNPLNKNTIDNDKVVNDQKLFSLLLDRFNLNGIQTLCFNLNIDYESLLGNGKEAKIRELVLFCRQRKRIVDLLVALRDLRPDIVNDL